MAYLSRELRTTIKTCISSANWRLAAHQNAINQGRDCIDIIAKKAAARTVHGVPRRLRRADRGCGNLRDISAASAPRRKTHYITIDGGRSGWHRGQYPRQNW